jgi:hypothetical protein
MKDSDNKMSFEEFDKKLKSDTKYQECSQYLKDTLNELVKKDLHQVDKSKMCNQLIKAVNVWMDQIDQGTYKPLKVPSLQSKEEDKSQPALQKDDMPISLENSSKKTSEEPKIHNTPNVGEKDGKSSTGPSIFEKICKAVSNLLDSIVEKCNKFGDKINDMIRKTTQEHIVKPIMTVANRIAKEQALNLRLALEEVQLDKKSRIDNTLAKVTLPKVNTHTKALNSRER